MLWQVCFIVYPLFKLHKSLRVLFKLQKTTWTGSHLCKKIYLELEKLHCSPSSPWGHQRMLLAWAN